MERNIFLFVSRVPLLLFHFCYSLLVLYALQKRVYSLCVDVCYMQISNPIYVLDQDQLSSRLRPFCLYERDLIHYNRDTSCLGDVKKFWFHQGCFFNVGEGYLTVGCTRL